MMTLKIDGQRCDIGKAPTIPIEFDADSLTKVEGARVGRAVEMTLPATPSNKALFGSSVDLHAAIRFNMEHHTASIEKDGMEIFKGTVYLLDTTIEKELPVSYKIEIKEGGAEWIEPLVHSSLADLDIQFSKDLNLVNITKSWYEESAVRFLPVYRGNYLLQYSSSAPLPIERVMLTDDYHPFISIAEMVKAMFAGLGYTLHSNFFDSEFGRSLYMSGDYSRTDNALARERCDFFARRSAPCTTTADMSGRVFASKAFAEHTVGAIVDTASPDAVDANGKKMSDTFSKNNSFSFSENGNICFTPIISVKAGFMLHLEYSTEYQIESRDRLLGFDTVEGLSGEKVTVHLANNYKDFRDRSSKKTQYRAFVFDHVENRQYQLLGVLSNGVTVDIDSWSGRSAIVTMPASTVVEHKLNYRDNDNGSWLPYPKDWALYPGYITETGMVDVEMDFRLAPQDVSAGESLELDKFWFGGAEPGMTLTLGTNTSLRPVFTSVPGYNSGLEFKDIAPRNIRQAELLSAIGEMFNLAFYTDRNRKELYIDPLEWLYEDAEIIDWSDRRECRSDISISDSGIDSPQTTIFAYVDTDSASRKYNSENDTTLGQWSYRNPLYGTKDSIRHIGNKLFATSLNISHIVGSAPSASILQVGDVSETENSLETGFTPRIVCYKGIRELPKGESWGASYRIKEYPYAAFVDEESINLCFEDRNNIDGLHHYYLPTLLRQYDSQRVCLDLHLTTAEIASLFTADGPKPSLRSKFRLNIQGESHLFRLIKVERWNTESNIVRCTFEQELNT